ncbi:glycosyltransferase family 2 protein [Cupriavidus gilardii]|nr:glycosyltransferase family 2 protein [Cupriavidus gilardii]
MQYEGCPAPDVPAMEVLFWQGRNHPYCVVIPVINEGDRIRRLLMRMEALQISGLADIIIVDGGSTDGSMEIDALQTIGVRGLILKTGPGKLSAQLRCAYAFALEQGYEGIVTIDGNDKDDPEAIPRFIEALKGGVDFVQASRFVSGGIAENTPKSRDFAIRYIHAPALSWSSGFHWTDTTQGFRGYSRRMLLDPAINPFRDIFRDYELLAYLSHRVPQLGYRCEEIGTIRRYPQGEVPTKISAFRGNWKVLRTLIYACLGRYNSNIAGTTGLKPSGPLYLVCALGFLSCLLAFFPGWMSPDSLAQYHDAKAGEYIDWHPVLMAWLWRQLDKIYTGPALLLVMHLALYWGAWLLISQASRRWLGYGAYLLPLLGFWPGLIYPLGQIWKDISFATTMFFAWAYLFYVYTTRLKFGGLEFVIVFLLAVYAFGVKTNGIVVLPFLFAFVGYLRNGNGGRARWNKVLAMAIAMPIFSALAVSGITSQLKVIKTSPFQYTETYDLLGVSVKSGDVLLPRYITTRVGDTTDKLRSLYFPGGNNLLFYNSAGNMTTINPDELSDLHGRWRAALVSHPLLYWEHRWQNFVELMRWGRDRPAPIAYPIIVENTYGFQFVPNSFSRLLVRVPERFPKIFFPWIYIFALLISSAILFVFAKQHRFLIACVVGSAAAFTIPHIFVAPAADYRYLYFVYFYSVLTVFFSLFVLIKQLELFGRHMLWSNKQSSPRHGPTSVR